MELGAAKTGGGDVGNRLLGVMNLIEAANLCLQLLSVVTAGAAGYYWYRAATAPVPEISSLVGIGDPPGALGSPLGGGHIVIMNAGPINEIVEALRVQGVMNKHGAIAASVAAACQASAFLLPLVRHQP